MPFEVLRRRQGIRFGSSIPACVYLTRNSMRVENELMPSARAESRHTTIKVEPI